MLIMSVRHYKRKYKKSLENAVFMRYNDLDGFFEMFMIGIPLSHESGIFCVRWIIWRDFRKLLTVAI